MADTQHATDGELHLNWGRIALITAVALAAIAWSRPMLEPLIRGWYNACQVVQQRTEIAALEEQKERLAAKRDFLLTDEGKDVQARRQFDVGPPGEVRIQVHVRSGQTPPRPQTLGERFVQGLNCIGGAWAAWARYVWDVVEYWSGREAVPPTKRPPETSEPEASAP